MKARSEQHRNVSVDGTTCVSEQHSDDACTKNAPVFRKGYYAYLLRCADGSLYAGWTVCPERRVQTHNRGKGAKAVRGRLPVRLERLWAFSERRDAMRFEVYLKGLSKAEKERLLREPDYSPPGGMAETPLGEG